jgi:hypothetical protein
MKRPIRIDKDKLDALAGVEFSWGDIEMLVDAASNYVERFVLAEGDHDSPGPPPPDQLAPAVTGSVRVNREFIQDESSVYHEFLRRTINPNGSTNLAKVRAIAEANGVWQQSYAKRPKSMETEARRIFVDYVQGIWRKCWHSSTRGWHPSRSKIGSKGGFDGPLIRLLEAMFKAMGEPVPSRSTLVDDLEALEHDDAYATPNQVGRSRKRKSGKRKTAASRV